MLGGIWQFRLVLFQGSEEFILMAEFSAHRASTA